MPNEFDSPGGNDFGDTGPDVADSRSLDTSSGSSVDNLSGIMTESADTGAHVAVDDFNDATPSSDIPTPQEDGSAASLDEIMTANAESGSGSLDDVEPHPETPNSDIPTPQEDGSATSLDEIMTANAESGSGSLDDVEPHPETPNSDIPTLQEDGSVASLDEIMTVNADTGNLSEPVGEPIYMTQSDVEWYMEHANDPESLRQMRDGIASGRIQVDADTELPTDDAIDAAPGPVLTRDPNEQWEIGNNAINNTVEALRDDLRDKGMEDGPEMEAIVMAERARMQDELARNINGDFSNPYEKPDFAELLRGEMIDVPAQDIPAAEAVEATDVVADVPQDIDYDAVYSGLDSYDFDGIDYGSDVGRLDSSLESFQNGTWENLSVDEQKAAMSDLADYVKDVIGFDNPPQIVFYNNPVDGDYGGYSPSTNTLEVNEHMLFDNNEAADTIAHELWHAYQHERAMNPQSAKDYQYQYGFENYIRPDDDFTAYQDQLVEAEARAFAQQFKDRLSTKRRRI